MAKKNVRVSLVKSKNKVLGPKNFCAHRTFGYKEILGPKVFWVQQIFGQKKLW